MKFPVAVLYHNVRSAHNVGALFRTADGAGVVRVYLSGYTPTPTDRFGRVQKDIAKTALGAEKNIPWEYYKTPAKLLTTLNERGWEVIGVEQDERSKPYNLFTLTRSTLFIFGNEVRGLSQSIRTQCAQIIEIPMYGKKESLNVSVATGIILFHTSNQ